MDSPDYNSYQENEVLAIRVMKIFQAFIFLAISILIVEIALRHLIPMREKRG